MKKNYSHLSQRLFVGIILLVIQQTIQAQVPAPASWNTFINSAQNRSVRDTFRMQTFEETSQDNWEYTTTGSTSIFEAFSEGLNRPEGKHSLKLFPASSLTFTSFSNNDHTNIIIKVSLAGKALAQGETLAVHADRITQPNDWIWATALTDNWSIAYNTPSKEYVNPFQIGSNPGNLKLTVSKKNQNSSGFYCTDSVYAFGNIPQHTLFSGSGSWNDTAQWSHLPAARHRNALISGQVSIDTDIQCNDLHIGDGALSITQNSHFIANNISLYYSELLLNKTELLLKSAGELTVNGKVTIKRTFKEKGKWYFISFPFDVYPDGIGTEFELKDETFKGGGNVFYIKTYNGQKRANSSNNQGNWETRSASATSTAEPLFIKNKGYLIALDADATSQTLSFSSQKADIPTDFGKSGTIPVLAFLSQHEAQNENSGWHLCGNPLPGTFSLSQIEPNPDLDGNIYLYDGSSYTSYPIGSNYTLPPLTAFFVKANTDTEIKVNTLIPSVNEYLLSEASLPIQKFHTEPSTGIQTNLLPQQVINSRIIGDKLYLSGLSSPGRIRIINFSGQVLYSRSVAAGSFTLSLSSLKAGLYILDIETESRHIKQKFIRKQ